MFEDKEKKVKRLIDEHMDKVGGCLGCFKKCIEAFLQGELQEAEAIHEDCDYAETEADIIRRKIADSLFSGAFLPLVRKDIYILSESIDEIANSAEKASDMVVFQRPEVPPEYADRILDIVGATMEMFRNFREAIARFLPGEDLGETSEYQFIHEAISDLIDMESTIDKKEEMLMRDIFRSEMPLAQKIQLERCVQRITAISDKIEDAADRLNVLIISEKL